MADTPAESPFERLVAEMRDTLTQATLSPRTCAIVVETEGGKIIVSSSDSRRWVAQALLEEGRDQIKHASRG